MVVYAGIIQFLITSNVSDVLHSGVLTFDVYCNVYEMLFSHCFSSGWGNYSFIMLNGLLDECSSLLFSCSSHICLQYGNFLTTHINTHLYLDSWVTILHLYPGKWTFVVKALPKTTWWKQWEPCSLNFTSPAWFLE